MNIWEIPIEKWGLLPTESVTDCCTIARSPRQWISLAGRLVRGDACKALSKRNQFYSWVAIWDMLSECLKEWHKHPTPDIQIPMLMHPKVKSCIQEIEEDQNKGPGGVLIANMTDTPTPRQMSFYDPSF